MLQAPEKYITSILSKAGIEKNISSLILHFIKSCDKNLHFIIDEKELYPEEILCNLCQDLNSTNTSFNFKTGQRLAQLRNPKTKYTSAALKAFLSPFLIKSLEPHIELEPHRRIENFDKFIPISNFKIERAGNLLNRVSSFQDVFKASEQSDYFSNEKLLVVGTHNLFNHIPNQYPSCFVSDGKNEKIEIEYNSPLLPKICILKNINLLDRYLQKEINGEEIKFSTCIFIGISKFEHAINNIRNYYNQRKFARAIFIGEKDLKIDLGNNQVPLRWKWSIPEIRYLKNEKFIYPEIILIENKELEKAITEFYQAIREIENKHTIGLKSIFRFIRKIYYDWNLKQETTFTKLHQIQIEFDIALKELLIETLGNIFHDFDFDEYQKPLSAKFAEILNTVKSNNKTEKLKNYQTKINQLVLPSFLCNANKSELNQLFNQTQHKTSVHGLQDIGKLEAMREQSFNNPKRNYFSLTANQLKTEIVSFSKSDDTNEKEQKVISSIYGSGKIEKLIERLCRVKSQYKLLLYRIEEIALKYHKEMYQKELNREYASTERLKICGVVFNDANYQHSNFGELIEALASTKYELRETEFHKIIFTDNNKAKLPSSKSVLKIVGKEKIIVQVEDLDAGDRVLIYENRDKETLRIIFKLKHPELIQRADEYSSLWKKCLKEFAESLMPPNSLFNESKQGLHELLSEKHLSVSETTLNKYMNGDVMFPRSNADLLIIAQLIADTRLQFNFVKTNILPTISEYKGKEIEYGFKFSNSINHFITTDGEMDEFISEWFTIAEVEKIVSSIPIKTVKDIELLTMQNSNDE